MTGAIRRRKVIPDYPLPLSPKPEEQAELVLSPGPTSPTALLVGLRQAEDLLCDEI